MQVSVVLLQSPEELMTTTPTPTDQPKKRYERITFETAPCICGHSFFGHAAGQFTPAEGFRDYPNPKRGLCLWCYCKGFEKAEVSND